MDVESAVTPTFTVLVGSKCRPELKDSLDSVAAQERVPGDQLIISIDSFERGPMPEVQEMIRGYGEGFIAIDYNSGYHWLGVEQINHAMRTIPMTGSHIFTIGDDDVFVSGAYKLLRQVCARYPQQPIVYRFSAPNRAVLWDKPRMRACLISGCCIAAPVQYVGLHPTDIETTHDYRWMMDIISKARHDGFPPVYLDFVGVIARPENKRQWAGIWTCPNWECGMWGYVDTGKLSSCPRCKRDLWDESNLQPRIVEEISE